MHFTVTILFTEAHLIPETWYEEFEMGNPPSGQADNSSQYLWGQSNWEEIFASNEEYGDYSINPFIPNGVREHLS